MNSRGVAVQCCGSVTPSTLTQSKWTMIKSDPLKFKDKYPNSQNINARNKCKEISIHAKLFDWGMARFNPQICLKYI